ncbi:transposase family protein [Candidatus Magnetoovum chiemensis]|nr:transposase family protein [Candidatus Magnetoovum chiemensis]
MEKKLPELINRINKDWKVSGAIRLMFQDEARFGRVSGIRYSWCPRPIRPMCQGMVTQEYVYASDGKVASLILPNVNGTCMQIFIDEVSTRYPNNRIIMVLDGAGWHKETCLELPNNIKLVTLPPYSPELNPVEHIWDELSEKSFSNRVFESLDSLEKQ